MNQFLEHLPLFQGLPSAQLSAAERACELRRFRQGQIVFEEGKPADAVWVLAQGWVFLKKRSSDGGVATLLVLTPTESICGISALEGAAYTATAVAGTDAQLVSIPSKVFIRLLDRSPALTRRMLQLCCRRLQRLSEAISMSQAPVQQRMAYMLLRLRRALGQKLPLTHQELASLIGARWETSIRTLSLMKRQGLVASSRRQITILSPQRLAALLGPNGAGQAFLHNGRES